MTTKTDRPFTSRELERYSRHLVLPGFGEAGQKKLRDSSVLIVGAGGLGTPAAIYLAAAGVGRIGLIDFDTVQASNLSRQILFKEADIGGSKVRVAKARLKEVNPLVDVRVYESKLDSSNAMRIFGDYDLILDGADNFPARYLINDACALLGKPDVYASVFQFDGQVSVFFAKEGPCYRCLYPQPPPPDSVPSCDEGGVLGVLPGILGTIQAGEAISLLLGKGPGFVGRLLLINGLDMVFTEIKFKKDPDCPVCGTHPRITGLIDYEAFCNAGRAPSSESIPGIKPITLKRQMGGSDIILLDVREPSEYDICHINGSKLIPLGQLAERFEEVDRSKTIVVYCHTGRRSADATKFLTSKGFKAKNLSGGIDAWAEQVEPKMPRY
ncbi:MAG: molybdopterin-synthase adenylyltransferase MoeB [Thaumarchaeota archaeon]|nr:molybdopterin-synthase adenylyltransferase MoeB [Nitrososphaerota archaeon]